MIELEHVSFSYANSEGGANLHNVSLHISKGETVLLCGESGCGKTTLSRLVNGLIPHFYEGTLCGTVRIEGRVINEQPLWETARQVGSVFQNPRSQFFNTETTGEIAFGCENQGLPVDEIFRRVNRTVRELRLEALLNRSLFALSGGEKQKIACASAAAALPDILVLDEPSSNLDGKSTAELREMLAHFKRQGKTILIAEHRLHYLHGLADRVLYMKDGSIEAELCAEQIEQLAPEDLDRMGLRPFHLHRLSVPGETKTPQREWVCLRKMDFSYPSRQGALTLSELSVPKGSVVALIGHNGAGKSTFARCVCGLEKRCGGQLELGGRSLTLKQRLSACYMVMQDVNHQLFTESVLDEVLLSMPEEDAEKAEEILAALDLLEMKDRHPMSLSGGQKQRVAIAGAVASGRDLLLFDEPTSGLDLRHMQEVAAMLRGLQAMGKTLFVITHDLELTLACCTYIVRLEAGQLAEAYPMKREHARRLRSFFLGDTQETQKENPVGFGTDRKLL